MSLRTIFFLVLALAAAAFTALYAQGWISAERAAMKASTVTVAAPKPVGVNVLVAAHALPAGTFVKPEHLAWRAWPEDGVANDYVVEGKRDKAAFVGAVVRANVAAGQPVTDERVVQPGDRGFLAAVLEPGKRAVSVPVNATTGISGFVFPGDWVDVVLTVRMPPKAGGPGQTRYFSETLLTDIRVLGIDQKVENEKGQPNVAKTATLEVTPKEAEKIALALDMGSLSLSLHSLAREQDAFARVARAVGADAKETSAKRSYTLDVDIYYMNDALFGAKGKSRKHSVDVLRGAKAERANF